MAVGTIYYLYANLYSATATTLTASATDATYNVANTKNPERTLTWQVTSAVTETILIDLGSSLAATVCAMADYAIRSGGTLKLYEGGNGGSPGAYNLVATFVAQDSITRVGYQTFGSTAARHWKLEWTASGSGTASVGYVFLGTYQSDTAPERPTIDQNDPSVPVTSLDNQESYAVKQNFASSSFRFPIMTETQLGYVQTVFSAVGISTPFFLILDTNTTWMAWLLRFSSQISKTVVPTTTRAYAVSYSWKEAL